MKIVARNFLSWRTLEFDIESGITLIQGFNFDDNTPEGSGKSAILNALAWCLFGQIPKNSSVDEVISEGETSCFVEVSLPGMTVTKQRGPNDLFITFPDKIYRGRNAQETQMEIQRLIGSTFSAFCQSIYFPQNFDNKFVTANQENKGKILSDLLDLEQFDRARKIALDKIKVEKENLIVAYKDTEKFMALKDNEIANVSSFEQLIVQFEEEKSSKIRKMFSDLENTTLEREQFLITFGERKQEAIKDAEVEIEALEAQLEQLSKEFDEAQNQTKNINIKTIKKSINGIDKHIYDLTEERFKILGQIENHKLRTDAKRNMEKSLKDNERDAFGTSLILAKKRLELAASINDLAETETTLKKAKESLQSPETSNCPTCGQSWHGDTSGYQEMVDKTQKLVNKYTHQISSLNLEIKDLLEKSRIFQQSINDYKEMIQDTVVPDVNDLKKDAEYKASQLNDLRQHLKTAKDLISKTEQSQIKADLISTKHSALMQNHVKLMKNLEAIKAVTPDFELQKLDLMISDISSKIEQEDVKEPKMVRDKLAQAQIRLNKSLALLEASETVKQQLMLKINRLEALREGFREVKAYSFENTLNQLTRKTNAYLAEFFEQSVKIKFKNIDLKIDASVTIDGTERNLGLYSGGQFRRIALAVDFALADITTSRKANRLNLMILDEPFHNLSEDSIERVIKVLARMKKSVILIEHNSLIKSIVTNTVDIELRDGVSRRVN